MLIALALGYLIGVMSETSNNHPYCKANDFKPEICELNKELEEFGK